MKTHADGHVQLGSNRALALDNVLHLQYLGVLILLMAAKFPRAVSQTKIA